ncbi:MAG: hypothetical protein IJT95_04700 [Abditibacteriota bacterium]|nr:hypothetical protein [Abditibacteriota bacterium]
MNEEEEKIIRKKGLISLFALFLGVFSLLNAVLTVYLYRIDTAGTAELRSGYMVRALYHPELREAETIIFKQGDSCDVTTDAGNPALIADILKKTADENGLTLETISFYDTKGKHITEFRSK